MLKMLSVGAKWFYDFKNVSNVLLRMITFPTRDYIVKYVKSVLITILINTCSYAKIEYLINYKTKFEISSKDNLLHSVLLEMHKFQLSKIKNAF